MAAPTLPELCDWVENASELKSKKELEEQLWSCRQVHGWAVGLGSVDFLRQGSLRQQAFFECRKRHRAEY